MAKYTKEDIKIAIEQFYTYFLQPQTLNFEIFNIPVKNALHREIQEYYEEFKYLVFLMKRYGIFWKRIWETRKNE